MSMAGFVARGRDENKLLVLEWPWLLPSGCLCCCLPLEEIDPSKSLLVSSRHVVRASLLSRTSSSDGDQGSRGIASQSMAVCPVNIDIETRSMRVWWLALGCIHLSLGCCCARQRLFILSRLVACCLSLSSFDLHSTSCYHLQFLICSLRFARHRPITRLPVDSPEGDDMSSSRRYVTGQMAETETETGWISSRQTDTFQTTTTLTQYT